MYAQVEKPKENKSRALANSVTQKKSNGRQKFEFVDNRPESVVQRKLLETTSNGVTQQQSQTDKKLNPSNNPIQRIINIRGGGDAFGDIVVHFCTFAKAQGGKAWEMLSWFWHGENNRLDIVSVAELDAKGYTDCQIDGKKAHTLTDDEWLKLAVDVPAKVIVSIKNNGESIYENDAKQYYVILHELMVHTYPFYQKIKSVREGVGPQNKAKAGYHDGPDNMGAHAEHQHLLNKNNTAFYELYNFMQGKMVFGLFREMEEEFKGIGPGEFSDLHEEDLMIQYIEVATLKAKKAHARIRHIIKYMGTIASENLSKQEKIVRYEQCKTEFLSVQPIVREVWSEYHKAYTVHTEDYKPPVVEAEHADAPPGEFGELPYFNPDFWFPRTLAKLAERINGIKELDVKLTRYNEQLTAHITLASK